MSAVTRAGLLGRLVARLAMWGPIRRYWIARIDRVLARGYEHGAYSSRLLHALDGRLKYYPDRSWSDPR